jgi:hypothetical protein
MTRVVRVVMINPKYRLKTFYGISPYNPKKGKHMTGQEDLSQEELKKEPYIIDPLEQIPVVHKQEFLIHSDEELKSKTVKKTVEDVLFRQISQFAELAPNVDAFSTNMHIGYIEDKERDADIAVTKAERIADAYSKVLENLNDEKVKQIAIFLELRYKNQPWSIIKQTIFERCQNDPEAVLRYFENTEAVKDELFIKNLVDAGILTKKRNGYFSSQSDDFIGEKLADVRKFISKEENSKLVSIWQDKLAE